MALEKPAYHHNFTHLDTLFELCYTPDKLAELIDEAILLLVDHLRHAPHQQEPVADIHRAMHHLNHALRRTKPLSHGDQRN